MVLSGMTIAEVNMMVLMKALNILKAGMNVTLWLNIETFLSLALCGKTVMSTLLLQQGAQKCDLL